MRVKPIAVIGVGVWLVYLVIVVVLQKASGIPYTDFGSTTGNMWRGVIPSLVIGSLVIAGVAVWFGWWSAAMRDRHRTRIGGCWRGPWFCMGCGTCRSRSTPYRVHP